MLNRRHSSSPIQSITFVVLIEEQNTFVVLIEEQISVKPNLDENLLKAEAYSGVAMQVDAIDEQILQ